MPATGDRKSTRLNSSHANISYAVFCLKKKKTMEVGVVCTVSRYFTNSSTNGNGVTSAIWLFFFNDTATTEIYTLSLHDALPISLGDGNAGKLGNGLDRFQEGVLHGS